VGRGNLSRFAAIAALSLFLAAPAGAAIRWRVLADGASPGGPSTSTIGYVALTRSAASAFAERLPSRGRASLAGVDFSRDAVVAIFAAFGCRDSLIKVASVEQQGRTLDVGLVEHQPSPGTATCMAIFPTYRVLAVPKSALQRPYPTRTAVTLARA